MVRITEELVRKRAEHNEGEIFSLQELSLHQQNIEKLEHLDNWCRDLRILYLHNNLIPKIENLSRLKKLEYVNFTLNNITRIENLEGCESLTKLDLTVNFIGELTSMESLRENEFLRELYLTGNPCTYYKGYREYVITVLPQLANLDGVKITKTERILAMQKFNKTKNDILEQQRNYMLKQEGDNCVIDETSSTQSESEGEETHKNFWKQETKFTPQVRLNIYKHMEKEKKKNEKQKVKKKKPRILIREDGRVLNANEPNLDFEFVDDEENNCFFLDLAIYKYLDTSLLEVDVQPNYVRVIVKGKVFQLALPKEVHTDSSSAQRSQTTGHLLISMPKMDGTLSRKRISSQKIPVANNQSKLGKKKTEFLEVTPKIIETLDQITTQNGATAKGADFMHEVALETEDEADNPNFEDNPEVPPLF